MEDRSNEAGARYEPPRVGDAMHQRILANNERIRILEERCEELKAERRELEAELEAPPPKSYGVEPVGVRPSPTRCDSSAGDFWELVEAFETDGMSRSAAIRKVVTEFPEMHEQLMEEQRERPGR